MNRIRKGDTVVVIAGKAKGSRGKVLRILGKKNRVVIERIAMIKRHTKPTRVKIKVGEDGKKARVAKSGAEITAS